MKNIVLSGYYGFNNTGDEAVLASMIQTLRQEMSHIDLTVLSHNPEQTERRYEVQAVNRWRLGRIIPAIRACDLFISGGGSLLQDVTGAKSILYYLALIQLARWLKKPVMIYAQGIGPVNRIWARKLMSKILNKVNFISVRDQVSADDLKRWGISRPRIIVTADPVMGWDPPDTGFVPEGLRTWHLDQERYIGISLRYWPGINVSELANLCDYLVERGFHLVFLPFHFPGDIAVCREVAQKMKQESYLVKDMLTPGEMMNLVGRMTVIIGMRLHALIMAAAQGIPFAAISYDPKVDRFTERMGQAVACPVENLSCLHLKTVVEQILENYSLIKEKLLCEAKILSLKARENAQYAHKVLEGVEGNIYD